MYRSGPIGRCPIDQLVGQVNRLSASEPWDTEQTALRSRCTCLTDEVEG
jgi:hypothetical protein